MKNHTNKSQTIKILNYLLKGKSLTPLQALSRFQCFRLASRINEINRSGIKVEKKMVNKNGKRYAKYFLEKKVSALAMAAMLMVGFVQAQDIISYEGYSYNLDTGNRTYNHGEMTVHKKNKTSHEVREIVNQYIAESNKNIEEGQRLIDAMRQQEELRSQTRELRKQTELLEKIANK